MVRGEVKVELIHETETAIAFCDIHPKAPTHVLIVPKRHVESLAKADASDRALLGELLDGTREMIGRLGLGENYKVVINGRDVGHIGHLHLHLLGGWGGLPASVEV